MWNKNSQTRIKETKSVKFILIELGKSHCYCENQQKNVMSHQTHEVMRTT
jgi:hypothetical protein